MSDAKSGTPGESRTRKKERSETGLPFSNIKYSLLCRSDRASPGALLHIALTGKGTRKNDVQQEIIQYKHFPCCKSLKLTPLLWASSHHKPSLGLSGGQYFHLERCVK